MARDIIMPDGTILPQMPDGTTKDQALASWRKLQEVYKPKPKSDKPSFGKVALRTGTESLLNNMSGVANSMINPLIPDTMGKNLNPMGLKTLEEAQAVYGDPEQAKPFSGAGIMGAGQRLGETAGAVASGDFSQFTPGSASDNQTMITNEMREARPGAAITGDALGDAAFMMGIRPMVTGPAHAVQNAAGAKIASWASGPNGVNKLLGQTAQKFIETNLPRGIGRMTDLGIQGAILAHLDDQDPVKAAAFAAGAQGAGSLVLTAAKPMIFSSKGLMTSVALSTIALNMFGLPGVEDISVDQSFKTAVTKVMPTVAAGLVLGMAGFDRLPPSVRENLPKLTDAVTSFKTGAVAGLVQELAEEKKTGGNTIATVMSQFNSDPEYFGATAMRRINTALNGGGATISEVIDSLSDDKDFQEKLNALETKQQ